MSTGYRTYDQSDPDEVDRERIMKQCTSDGLKQGLKWGTASFLGAGSTVFAANKFSPWFRKSLGASGKTALVVMAVTGAFALGSELTISRCRKTEGFRRLGLLDEEE